MVKAIELTVRGVGNLTDHALKSPSFEPSQNQVARFEALLAENGTGSEPVTAVDASQTAAVDASQTAAVRQPDTLGDAILQGMEKLRDDHDVQFNRVKTLVETAGEASMDFQHAVKLQFELMQLTLHQDITTKSADKMSQGVQTLFRNQ